MTQSTGRRIGPYALEDKLGAGGMGVVYRAVDTVLDRPVAIKMMHPAERLGEGVNLEEVQARFLREAKAAARIQSRHVASVLQFGQDVDDEGEPIAYIVMEFLKGRPLNKVISKGGPMAPARAVHIGIQIAKGMAAAHDLGIIHRDLKPANVMLVEEEGDPDFVKILDFGVAKLTHDQQTHGLTQAGALLGTLAFMAPEQISGKDVDARTDIYSLGIILYRMFTGVTVWDADSLSDIVRHQLSSRPPSMAERITNPQFTAAHDDVVLRCLEKDPAARFQSMRELAAALLAAEQAPRTAPGAVVAEFRAPTTTPASPTHERQAEGLEATRTSPATSPTGAGRAWTAALPGASSSTATTLNDDDGVFADGDGDAPTLAATMAPTLPTVPAPARELAPAPARGAGPVVTAATTTTTTPTTPTTPPTAPRSRGVVVGLVAAAAVGGVILALVLGRAPTAAAPATSTPPPVTPTPPQVTATPAPATMTPPPASTSPPPVTTTPEPAPATTPPPPPPTTTTTTTPPAAPKPAPPTRPAVTTKPPPPKPAPAPEPASGFKRVHTRGTP